MSRPRHLAKEEHVLKVKWWAGLLIALIVSAEIGVAIAWVLHAAGVLGAGG
jgi:hypothetical protein